MDAMTKYELINIRSGPPHNRRLIDGKITGSGKCVGYCQFIEHRGFLTQEQRKNHNCIGKQCHYYIPKEKSAVGKPVSELSHEKIYNTARRILSDLDYMKIVRAVSAGFNRWYLDYVTISNECDHTEYKDDIEREAGVSVVFRKLDWSFEKCVRYICP